VLDKDPGMRDFRQYIYSRVITSRYRHFRIKGVRVTNNSNSSSSSKSDELAFTDRDKDMNNRLRDQKLRAETATAGSCEVFDNDGWWGHLKTKSTWNDRWAVCG